MMRWLLPTWAAAGVLLACRYTVRDTGFVDLGSPSYRLAWSVPKDSPESFQQAVKAAASALLAESNVRLEAAEARPGEASSARLIDPEGRELALGRWEPGMDPFRLVEAVVTSRMREQVLAECLRGYAVAFLVEGTDAAENARVAEAARSALARVAALQPGMPKPVEKPATLVVVPSSGVEAEKVLVWGLGLEPVATREPRLALMYGRGRRLGTPLEGPLITATTLRERLVLVGQDCECDLDREWLRGPLVPARWDAALQQAALAALGFDPENPMIRAEVSRIVERGPVDGQKRKMAGTSQALGYAEEAVGGGEGDGERGTGREGRDAGGASGERRAASGGAWAWGVLGGVAVMALGVAGWLMGKGGRG
ncbi:MAG: hypothetical protein ACKOEQ_16510 [Verrucomicrobiota bacterium]